MKKKTWFLADEFFPAFLPADLSDIFNVTYSPRMHCSTVIMKKKIIEIMKKLNLNVIFKLNNIINRFLQVCEKNLINVLISFFQTYLNQNHYFKIYQKNNTMILRKFDKNNHDVVKTWRLIVLLNTINKIFELIINKKLLYLTKHHEWRFVLQIKTQLNRLTKMTLTFFIKQIHKM